MFRNGPLSRMHYSQVHTSAAVGRCAAQVDEACPKCGNQGMEFYTMQLRSADEGQTVFYECPKCRHKYSQNT
eukprot:192819-Chlamydomonas_euryale.AAC.3